MQAQQLLQKRDISQHIFYVIHLIRARKKTSKSRCFLQIRNSVQVLCFYKTVRLLYRVLQLVVDEVLSQYFQL